MKFIVEQGDLFDCTDVEAYAHCVSADFKMGAGIALEFNRRYGHAEVFKKLYVGQSLAKLTNHFSIIEGTLALVDRQQPRTIYYLVTKKYYYGKPSYQTLIHSLKQLLKDMKESKITSIAIPKLGCGLDRLEWERVRLLIMEIFKDSGVRIVVRCVEK